MRMLFGPKRVALGFELCHAAVAGLLASFSSSSSLGSALLAHFVFFFPLSPPLSQKKNFFLSAPLPACPPSASSASPSWARTWPSTSPRRASPSRCTTGPGTRPTRASRAPPRKVRIEVFRSGGGSIVFFLFELHGGAASELRADLFFSLAFVDDELDDTFFLPLGTEPHASRSLRRQTEAERLIAVTPSLSLCRERANDAQRTLPISPPSLFPLASLSRNQTGLTNLKGFKDLKEFVASLEKPR